MIPPDNAFGMERRAEGLQDITDEVHAQNEINPVFVLPLNHHLARSWQNDLTSRTSSYTLYKEPWSLFSMAENDMDTTRSEEPWTHISLVSSSSTLEHSSSRGYLDPIRGTIQADTNSTRTVSDMFDFGSTPATSAILTNNPERYRDDMPGPGQSVVLRDSPAQRRRRESIGKSSGHQDVDSYWEGQINNPYLGDRVWHSFTIPKMLEATGSRSPSPCPSNASGASSAGPDILACTQPACSATFRGRYRRGTLQRHMRLKHPQTQSQEKEYQCQSCSKVYKRQDARLKHYRRRHPQLLPTPVHPRKRHEAPDIVPRSS
ncbi:hypothetical protein GQ44DRAFT_426653 [Phaeosphaeriaceae sp. PMI808]|nr:hypothetical protein GQ44DRAFT_426653 [Phaeosphaeriaceae sp. PMI808]